MTIKVIVAGSRNFNDYELLRNTLDGFIAGLSEIEDITIVSGTARGADMLGEKYAAERGLMIKRFPADWDKYGKYAGIERNKRMAAEADALVAFNMNTPGTNHMIREMKAMGKMVHEVKIR